MPAPKEKWKKVPDTGDYYSVSNYGRVRIDGVDRFGHGRNKYKAMPLKPTVSKGVAKVAFTRLDGSRFWWQLKDLVAHVWIEESIKVQLRDRSDPLDCRVANIRVIKKKEKKK